MEDRCGEWGPGSSLHSARPLERAPRLACVPPMAGLSRSWSPIAYHDFIDLGDLIESTYPNHGICWARPCASHLLMRTWRGTACGASMEIASAETNNVDRFGDSIEGDGDH